MGKVLKIREVGDPILNKECNEVNIKNISKDILDSNIQCSRSKNRVE